MKKAILVVGMALGLTACGGDSAVDIVKSGGFLNGGDVTLGEVLGNRDMCLEESWAEVDNPRNDNPMVEYRCVLKGGPEYFATALEDRLKRMDNAYQQQAEMMEKSLEQQRERHEAMLSRTDDIEPSRLSSHQRQVMNLEEEIVSFSKILERQQASHADSLERSRDQYTLSSAEEVIIWQVINEASNMSEAKLVMTPESGNNPLEWRYHSASSLPELIHRREVIEASGEVDLDTFLNWRRAANLLNSRA